MLNGRQAVTRKPILLLSLLLLSQSPSTCRKGQRFDGWLSIIQTAQTRPTAQARIKAAPTSFEKQKFFTLRPSTRMVRCATGICNDDDSDDQARLSGLNWFTDFMIQGNTPFVVGFGKCLPSRFTLPSLHQKTLLLGGNKHVYDAIW